MYRVYKDFLHCTVPTEVAGSLQFISVTTPPKFLFRGRPATGYANGDTTTIEYEIGHVDDDTMDYTVPQVQWLKDGLPAVRTPTNTTGTNGRLTSTLSFTFAASDAGVYQCVFTDTSRSEIFATVPTRQDTGEYTVASKVNSGGCIHQIESLSYPRYLTEQWSRNGGPVGTGSPIFQSAMLKIANIFQML